MQSENLFITSLSVLVSVLGWLAELLLVSIITASTLLCLVEICLLGISQEFSVLADNQP